MTQQVIYIKAKREDYSISRIKTMTVGELINWLEQYEESTPIYISNDNGYTYGGITEDDISRESGTSDERDYEDDVL